MSKEMLELVDRLERQAKLRCLGLDTQELLQQAAAALRASAVAEPVAYTIAAQLGFLQLKRFAGVPMAMWASQTGADVALYTHPASASPVPNLQGKLAGSPAAPVPASVREALTDIDSWRYDTLGQRPRDESANTEVNAAFDRGARMAFYRCSDRARAALASLPAPEAAPTREEIADMRPTYVSELARSLALDAFDDLDDEHPEAKTYTLARWFDAILALKSAPAK